MIEIVVCTEKENYSIHFGVMKKATDYLESLDNFLFAAVYDNIKGTVVDFRVGKEKVIVT